MITKIQSLTVKAQDATLSLNMTPHVVPASSPSPLYYSVFSFALAGRFIHLHKAIGTGAAEPGGAPKLSSANISMTPCLIQARRKTGGLFMKPHPDLNRSDLTVWF